MSHPHRRRSHVLALSTGLLAVAAASVAAVPRPKVGRRTLIGSGLALLAAGGPLRKAAAAPLEGDGKKQVFDEIDVHRINVIEPDGTIRMVISDNARRPGAIIENVDHPHPNRADFAGMLFFNDEGTECGGLSYSGTKDEEGNVQAGGGISFDKYLQDELISMKTSTGGDETASMLWITDRPDWPITDVIDAWKEISKLPPDQQGAAWGKFYEGKPSAPDRVSLGREKDRSAALRLRDPQGRERIVLEVRADGTPVIQILDEAGTVVSQLP
ncbi:MAG: hypothetical protein JWM47_3152 [Acidimicrobiales bacterium]|nr:hypothetical protein [Acidimicrobiales bacterium]